MEIISKLPQPYKRLAEQNRTSDSDFVGRAFVWEDTPEGDDFWIAVFTAETEEDLPELPNTELKERLERDLESINDIHMALEGGDTEYIFEILDDWRTETNKMLDEL